MHCTISHCHAASIVVMGMAMEVKGAVTFSAVTVAVTLVMAMPDLKP